ncbi:hypothetical protein [uncultured Mucilaginibacter sp.]|uniref:hypothetical protein n=1 Tax=uncultured Mucilaginibacter sp. TaxID=797541 RepID=UPI0025F09E70|nr:hypothetical protein [uncultured Mucilaginibacter sp.]
MRYLTLVIVSFFAACNSPKKGSKIEYIDPNSITINGVLKFHESYSNVAANLGVVDSMAYSVLPQYQVIKSNNCYFKNLAFIKRGDSLYFNNALFRNTKINYLQSPKMRFDGSTKIDDVEKMFDTEESTRGTDMDIRTTLFIKIEHTDTDKPNDGHWMLDFDTNTGRLYRMTILGAQKD